MNLTPSMQRMLQEVAERNGGQFFAPNAAVMNALAKRKLIRVQFVGQRWWRFALTAAGREILNNGG